MIEAFEERVLVPEATDQWLWIVIVSSFGALLAAFGIGANDTANAFATSVGSKTLTIKQAIVLACIFELLGALLLGRHVITAYRETVADLSCFLGNPGILMYGMMCVVYTTGMWLLMASYLELPVSTTHSTVGGVIGMSIAYGGGSRCIVWYEEKDTFPFVQGTSAIVASWFISPLFAGALASSFFFIVRAVVLRHSDAFRRSFWVFPILVTCIIAQTVMFFIYEGPTSLGLDSTSLLVALVWAVGLGVVVALVLAPTAIPAMRANVLRLFNDDGTKKIFDEEIEEDMGVGDAERGAVAYICKKLDHDVHAPVEESSTVAEIHANAENFDPRVEEVFKYIQVVGAICDAFAHGANDVANATGPLELIYAVYLEGRITSSGLGNRTYLILALGGVGMVAGIAVFGHKIITAVGVKLAKITPSRGLCVELGAALMIIVGTKLELPLSSTHCQVGATAGVALLEGTGGLNTALAIKIGIGWVATVFVCALTCAVLFSQGAYAPYAYDIVGETDSRE